MRRRPNRPRPPRKPKRDLHPPPSESGGRVKRRRKARSPNMKSYLSRILICVAPVVLGIAICAWAYSYDRFRLGVDLVGGTILVYEVDTSKQQGEVKSDELAAALKRRIDPADLY